MKHTAQTLVRAIMMRLRIARGKLTIRVSPIRFPVKTRSRRRPDR